MIPVLRDAGLSELLEGDSRDISSLVKAVRGVDAVVHLGEIVGLQLHRVQGLVGGLPFRAIFGFEFLSKSTGTVLARSTPFGLWLAFSRDFNVSL